MINRVPGAIIIPAFNEARQIGEVIEAAQSSDPRLHLAEQVIVVDNNSTDETAEIAMSLGANVIHCADQGKAPALAKGVEFAKSLGSKVITFVDGDLVNLKGSHLDSLTGPVLDGCTLMNIGYLGGRTQFTKDNIYSRWAMFSGQRSLPTDVWDRLSPRDLKSFRVEAALNSLFRNSGRGSEIMRTELVGVTHTGKFDKYSLWKAWMQYGKIEFSAIYGLTSRSSL